MREINPNNLPEPLEPIAREYPEQTFYLAQVFNDTTNSYKLFWFKSLVNLLKTSDANQITVADIITEMVVYAWHPVCSYRLSLGRQDALQRVVQEIRVASGLSVNAESTEIRARIRASSEIQRQLLQFARYVPTRFLTPWFAQVLRGVKEDSRRTQIIRTSATQSQSTETPSIYFFKDETDQSPIQFNEGWRKFIRRNLGIIESFADYSLTRYLQARNPNVPGIVNKLAAPLERQLTSARKFWQEVRSAGRRAAKPLPFCDIYSGSPLGDAFSIDHFLPWSFVAHDLLWNLVPIAPSTNSRKSDSIPDMDLYLPRMIDAHFNAVHAVATMTALLEDYFDFFGNDATGLVNMDRGAFAQRFRDTLLPQAQIAINLGFPSLWRCEPS